MKYWALVGHWHGTPCAIQRGEYKPCWTVWAIVDSEKEWRELRRDGFYTRRSRRRPTDYVDREFQRTVPESIHE